MVWSPLAGGLLSGKFDRNSDGLKEPGGLVLIFLWMGACGSVWWMRCDQLLRPMIAALLALLKPGCFNNQASQRHYRRKDHEQLEDIYESD